MSVARGIRLNLSPLSAKDRRALVKLMARISEASYRRGFQQGAHFALTGRANEESANELRRWRSLDRSPRGEAPVVDVGRSALWRLDVEFGRALSEIGLEVES